MEEDIVNYIKNSISKQKIKNKIEELKEKTCIYSGGDCVKIEGVYWEVGGIIKVLEELLKEE